MRKLEEKVMQLMLKLDASEVPAAAVSEATGGSSSTGSTGSNTSNSDSGGGGGGVGAVVALGVTVEGVAEKSSEKPEGGVVKAGERICGTGLVAGDGLGVGGGGERKERREPTGHASSSGGSGKKKGKRRKSR